MENKINIMIPEDTDFSQQITINLLEGQAQDPLNDKPVTISGDIHAVEAFIKVHDEHINRLSSFIKFNEEAGSITLTIEAQSPLATTISAVLVASPHLNAFGINQGKYFTLRDLEKHIRMNRFWFKDKEAHMKLVNELKSFTAKVQADIKSEQDNRGNKNNQYIKQVTTDLAADFVLSIPLFKGCPTSVFRVDICYDVTDSNVRFWLESVELYELQQQMIQEMFALQNEAFIKSGFVVINS